MINISKRLVLINSISSIMGKLCSAVVLLWVHHYLLKRISVEEYSLYPVILGIMVFSPLLVQILTSGLGKYIVEADVRNDEQRICQIVSTMLPLLFAAAAVLTLLGLLLAWKIEYIIDIGPDRVFEARFMLIALLVPTALSFVLAPFNCGLWVRQRFTMLNVLELANQAIRAALILILLLGVSTRVLWVALATSVAQIFKLGAMHVASQRTMSSLRFDARAIHWPIARDMVGFGTWSLVGNLAGKIRMGANPLILKNLAGAFDVACFNVGWIFFLQLDMATELMMTPLQPVMHTMSAAGQTDRIRRVYLRMGRYALWSCMIFVMPLIIFRIPFVTLYAGAYLLPAATVLALLLLKYPLEYGNKMMVRMAFVTEHLRPWAVRTIFVEIAAVVLTLILVGYYGLGAYGAALATIVVAVVAQPILFAPLGLRMSGATATQWMRETLIPGLLPSVVAGTCWLLIYRAAAINSWASLFGAFSLGAIVYVGAVLLFCLQPIDKQDLKHLLRVGRDVIRTRLLTPRIA